MGMGDRYVRMFVRTASIDEGLVYAEACIGSFKKSAYKGIMQEGRSRHGRLTPKTCSRQVVAESAREAIAGAVENLASVIRRG